MRVVILLGMVVALAACARGLCRAPDDLTVVAEGVAAVGSDPAAAEEEAVWDAKRNAVEQAAGVFLRARSVGRDFELVQDEVDASAAGFVRCWEVVPGSRRIEGLAGGRVLRLKVRATIALLPVIRRLADIRDVYDDLERPRIRVEIPGGGLTAHVRAAVVEALRRQGYEVAASGPAEILLNGSVSGWATVRMGDVASPYGVGEAVAAAGASLTLRAVSTAAEAVLVAETAYGTGQSFSSDGDAQRAASEDCAARLLGDGSPFLQRLLVRWASERQEGHVVAVSVTGLPGTASALLREEVRAMRGFRRYTAVEAGGRSYTLRFQTRLDTRAVRRRLASLRLDRFRLVVLNDRGPLVRCAAEPWARLSRR